MAAAEEVHFSLKVMMMKKSNKVLYAEVDSHLVDVLLSFLTLPLGTIVRLLNKHYGNDILANSPPSVVRILNLNDIGDTGVLEERTQIVGSKEIMELLKGSLVSKTPLTDVILLISPADAILSSSKKSSSLARNEPDPSHSDSD
ncbi:hypothetical protein F511_35450 [Dorcoceras hygrometricum]|uniref:Uncharacterized protein n=1 Tax=Dorcoceras hygrometricum TaxID=472368 RepID=A0A2Z7BIY5_9LAMI|nr:hypothetical protein F511_35450 [Dorcoceras hygrometricum]